MNVNETRHIYFLGIGGIGMSALARYFHSLGIRISGYDKTSTALTAEMEKMGMQIHYEDRPELIPSDIDFVVITPAIPVDSNERVYLEKSGLPIKKRAEVLGIISRNATCLCVAGTHGKTTTTTLLTHILKSSGVNCTAFLGGIAANYSSNYIEGNPSLVVMEADEYDRSFLQLKRDGVIVTAVDPDHLDIYGTPENMLSAYAEFVNGTSVDGHLIVRSQLPLNIGSKVPVQYYAGESLNRAENIRVENGYFVFDFIGEQCTISNIEFAMPGRHNIENACAAITLALNYGANEKGIREALKNFRGIKRRFEFYIRSEQLNLIDDYAHHPVELRAAIGAAKELFAGKKITGVFQPHLFTRTRDFMREFAESLSMLDELILLDIYPAREKPIDGITSAKLLELVNGPHKELLSKEDAVKEICQRKPEVTLILGAGDIDRLPMEIKNGLTRE